MPDWYTPQSLNRYSYVVNNPLKYTDPTGHAETCDGGEICDSQDSALYALIREIYVGDSTASDRLEEVFSETAGTGKLPEGVIDTKAGEITRTHFRGVGGLKGDWGFSPELGDEYLYEMWGLKHPASKQVGQFLTAVDMALDGSDDAKKRVIGHEQWHDENPLNYAGQRIVTDADLAAFNWAIVDDAQGNIEARDAKLYAIFDPAVHGPQAERRGNSMEDLRLSVRGWRIGRDVALGVIATNIDLANRIGHDLGRGW